MIPDVPYDQYDLRVEYYNQCEQEQQQEEEQNSIITNSLTDIDNKILSINNDIKQDANSYLYLILYTMLNLNTDRYLTNPIIEYNDRDFGSHAKLSGFANAFIKKLSKKLENTLFKIKDRTYRIFILEYLAKMFDSDLAGLADFSDLYIKFNINKNNFDYKLIVSDQLETAKKIKACYKQYFPIISHLLYNCISLEHLQQSFENANSQLTNIWRLFIDSEKQYKGRLFFENEQGYLVNSLRGLAFALNEINQHKYIDYDFLCKVSEVIGCNKREDISASIYLSFRYSPVVLQELFKRSYYKGNKNEIIAMEKILNINLDDISCHYYDRDIPDPNKIYLIEIFKSSFHPYMFVYYVGKKTKKEYINELFTGYYKTINNISQLSLEKILRLSLILCRELQYLHPLSDGTGRTFLFILLPLLLKQQGFWLNSMPEHIWDLLSSPIDYMVNKTLPLCSSAIEIDKKIDWQINMRVMDKIYIYCIMGDLAKIKEIIKNDYSLLEKNIPMVNISPLEVAVLNNNVELIKYLLIHVDNKILYKKRNKILSYLKDVNPSLRKLIGKYFTKILDKSIEEKQDFLFD